MKPKLSIIAPIYNGEDEVALLVKQIIENTTHLVDEFEIILVVDRSPDGSWKNITKICATHASVKAILLSRNFGQQIAVSAGIEHAKGDYIIVMDGDLQNPPSAIGKLYEEIQKGFDIVYTVCKNRNNVIDKVTSQVFWLVIKKVLGVDIVENQLMMKIFTHRFAEHYSKYTEINRTVAGIVLDIGFSYSVIQVENKKRSMGKSNYNLFTRFNLMTDIIISLTTKPLRLTMNMGIIIFILSFIYGIFLTTQRILFDVPAGYTSIVLLITMFGSLIISILGFIGLYISNILDEVKRRPLYLIDKKMNFNDN